jgi:hypothetical protein
MTAVEWLVNVVQSCIAPNFIPKEIVEQAKEMEKQQSYSEEEVINLIQFLSMNEEFNGYGSVSKATAK